MLYQAMGKLDHAGLKLNEWPRGLTGPHREAKRKYDRLKGVISGLEQARSSSIGDNTETEGSLRPFWRMFGARSLLEQAQSSYTGVNT